MDCTRTDTSNSEFARLHRALEILGVRVRCNTTVVYGTRMIPVSALSTLLQEISNLEEHTRQKCSVSPYLVFGTAEFDEAAFGIVRPVIEKLTSVKGYYHHTATLGLVADRFFVNQRFDFRYWHFRPEFQF
eukprot:scaffold114738_cov20-Prasinocladus_malaysianus.AAC.1